MIAIQNLFVHEQVSSTSKFTRQQLVGQMRKALQNTSSPPTADIKYLVYLPSKDEHHCYQTEPVR